MGIVGCPNSAEGFVFVQQSRKWQIFLFVEIQLSDAPSIYVTGAGTLLSLAEGWLLEKSLTQTDFLET